jgi:hypothetical protein
LYLLFLGAKSQSIKIPMNFDVRRIFGRHEN